MSTKQTYFIMMVLLGAFTVGCVALQDPKLASEDSSTDADTDADTDTDSDTDADTDTDTDADTDTVLICENHWEGANCEICPENFTVESDCSECANHWEGTNCDECGEQFDVANNCDGCTEHWEGVDCEICPANFSVEDSCSSCSGQWQGTDCDICPQNWDPAQNCDACLTGWNTDDCLGFSVTVDTMPNVGFSQTSVKFGSDGFPVIAYFDAAGKDAKVAHCNDAFCSNISTNVIGDVADNNTLQVEGGISLAILPTGFPVVAYLDHQSNSLILAYCSNVACSSASNVNLGTSYGRVAIAVGSDDLPIIAHFNGVLEVIHCNDASCTDPQRSTINSSNIYGTSIAIGGDGHPRIGFWEDGNRTAYLAQCNDVACRYPVPLFFQSNSDTLGYTSVSLSNNIPSMVYSAMYDVGGTFDPELRFMRCEDINCWTKTITNFGTGSGPVSLTLSNGGLPIIAYGGNLIICEDVACEERVPMNYPILTSPSMDTGPDGMIAVSSGGGNLQLSVFTSP